MSWVQNQNPENGSSEMSWHKLEQPKKIVKALILRVPTTKFSPAARLACCNACNGYVTVRKRSVFVFCLGGAGPSDPGGGDPLNERSKTLRPADAADPEGRWVEIAKRSKGSRDS